MSLFEPGESPAEGARAPSRPHHVSGLTHIYWNKEQAQYRLDQARVNEYPQFGNFAGLRWYVLGPLRYPRPQASKYETYGWVPTLYMPKINVERGHKDAACWRDGAAEADALSCLVADIDNKDDDRPHVSEVEVGSGLAFLTPNQQPVEHFTYTTFSSSPDRRKLRVVAETDRDLSRTEQRDLCILMNERVFGGQADGSIYDAGDFLYGPPHHTQTTVVRGVPLPVDALLAMARDLRSARPDLWAPFEKKQSKAPRRATPAELAEMQSRLADMSARIEFGGIDDPSAFNPDWLGEIDGATRHYDTMLTMLGRAWRKNGGALTRGGMDLLWDQIDARWGGYMLHKYGREKRDDMIGFVMRQPVFDNTPEPVKNRRALVKVFRNFKLKKHR